MQKNINNPLVKLCLLISIQLLSEMSLCGLFNKRMSCLALLIAKKTTSQSILVSISISISVSIE